MTERPVYRISILCPDFAIAEVVADFFVDIGYGSGFRRFDDGLENIDKFYADIFTHTPPDTVDISTRLQTLTSVWGEVFEMAISCISNTDWVGKNQRDSAPIVIGDFFVYQPLYTGAVPNDKIGVRVRAEQAFGTGSHYTTAMCLRAMQAVRFDKPHINLIDVGTGTGILAVAAKKYYNTIYESVSVIACDKDIKAVAVAQSIIAENRVHIPVLSCCGVENSTVQTHAPYDMLLANILAQPLIDMTVAFVAVVADGGYMVLSGFTVEQCPTVQNTYTQLGCRVIRTYADNDWGTLTLQKT